MNERNQIAIASDEHVADAPLPPPSVGIARGRRAVPAEASPHSQKFQIALGALCGLAVAAIAVALWVVANGGSGGPRAQWSTWSPVDSGTQAAREIADHVAPLYRISAVDQLAVVTVVNLSNGTSPLQVAVRTDPSSSAVSLLNGNTVAYNMCGIGGSNCAIGVGQPSADRLLLLRREALELALYTFKYVGGVDNVVAILPPGHTAQPSTLTRKPPSSNTSTKPLDVALLFLHDELKPWLDQPLSNTFPERFPPSVPELGIWRQTPEAGLVNQITARGLFSESLVQTQDGSNLIVLNPLPPQ